MSARDDYPLTFQWERRATDARLREELGFLLDEVDRLRATALAADLLSKRSDS